MSVTTSEGSETGTTASASLQEPKRPCPGSGQHLKNDSRASAPRRATPTSAPIPAILLGGGAIAVSAARSLGEAGIPVHAIGDRAWDTVGYSRYCGSFTHVGSREIERLYVDWLAGRPVGEAALLPCSDESLELVARRRDELVSLGYRPVHSNDEVLLAMLDKERTYRLAEEAGVPVPRRFLFASIKELDAQLETSGVEFPCALKPLHSHLFARKFGSSKKVFYAADRTELIEAARSIETLGLEMMVTEVIPGPDDSYSSLYTYLDRDGEPLFLFTKRKLRQYPVGFGLATYHASTWEEDVAHMGLRFCQGVGVRGMACIEFKRDERSGELKLIECNHRLTLGSEVLRYAGLNLPLLIYNQLFDRPIPVADGYRTGIHLWVPLADARAFLTYRRRGELTWVGWIRSLLHRPYFQLFDLADPGPSVALLWRRATRRLMRAMRKVLQIRP